MAVTPLFTADMDALRGQLRLSNLDGSQDALAILDSAVRDARVDCQRRLTQTRCAAIAAYAKNDNPVTVEESLRALAESTEILLVRIYLIDRLPIAFLDGGQTANQAWNEEAPFRDAHRGELKSMKKDMLRAVEKNMESLADSELVNSSIDCRVLVPDIAPLKPGDTVFKGYV